VVAARGGRVGPTIAILHAWNRFQLDQLVPTPSRVVVAWSQQRLKRHDGRQDGAVGLVQGVVDGVDGLASRHPHAPPVVAVCVPVACALRAS
jgi:hypothetical protein